MDLSQDNNDLNNLWQTVLSTIKAEQIFDDTVYTSYIKSSSLKQLYDSHAIIEVPWNINCNFFKENIAEFENKLTAELKQKITCDVVVKGQYVDNTKDEIEEDDVHFEYGNKLFDDYTFDNFIQGQSNQQSYAAAYGCAISSNNNFFNPLFIYGNSGLGKTHLLQAICNYLKHNRPEIKYLYIDGNDLISLLINATRNRKISAVIEQLSQLDYLLIDDIQHLTKTGDMQELFFNLYNKLISNNNQIVMTSDVYPSDLKNINKRIISRFTSGLSVSITSPEYTTAFSILKKKLEGINREVNITDDAIDYIAKRFNEDVRKLEGALNELVFNAVLARAPIIDEEFAAEIFKENPIANQSNDLSAKGIKKEVCNYYNISIKQIESKNRTADIANARHIAIYLCRELLDMPFKKIGQEFGGRDHSTIMTSYEKITKLVKDKDIYKEAVDEIKGRLQ